MNITEEFVYSFPMRKDPRQRLLSKSRELENGCIEYTGAKDRCGYGRYSVGKHRLGAHKVAHALFVGPVPSGQVVMHSCDNPSCINPEHLSLGTQKDNLHDCINKGRFPFHNLKHWR